MSNGEDGVRLGFPTDAFTSADLPDFLAGQGIKRVSNCMVRTHYTSRFQPSMLDSTVSKRSLSLSGINQRLPHYPRLAQMGRTASQY
jgi:hypothetical protein